MYVKLFSQILDSSIWLESGDTRIVWITLLAAMDQDGFARFAALENLSHRARVSVEDCQIAVEKLQSPDPNSSDPSNEGRRIERVPGGWLVLNAEKYRQLASESHRREKVKGYVAKHRAKQKKHSDDEQNVSSSNGEVSGGNQDVITSNQLYRKSNHKQKNKQKYKQKQTQSIGKSNDLPSRARARPAKNSGVVKASREPDPFFEGFSQAFTSHYQVSYASSTGDFVQLARLRKANPDLTTIGWELALANYFESPLGNHTLADLCSRFAVFHKHALDRYGKPPRPTLAGVTDKTAGNIEAVRAFVARGRTEEH